MASSNRKGTSTRKKNYPSIEQGIVHVHASFNNVILTIADERGNVLAWGSGGFCGNKGARKGTGLVGEQAAHAASAKVQERHGLKSVQVRLKGAGPARDSAVRALHASGLHVVSIIEVTPIPHNGCRLRKKRRV